MRGEIVAIDLETTGLDVTVDKIIEIGAVRMKEGEIIDEYATLVNPNIPIPDRTTLLTGIKQEDVVSAPGIKTILPDLLKFVGDAPIIGHSVGFDLSFLNKHGVFINNTPLDTYDLASVLLPGAPRYNLHSLTSMFNINLEDAHRALDDARASGILYWQLYQMALQLPFETLQAINDAARGLKWVAGATFASALEEQNETSGGKPPAPQIRNNKKSSIDDLKPLHPNDDITTIDSQLIAHIFEQGGELSQVMPNYENRPQQTRMASIVTNAFNENEHVMIEAGTGTGKSMAYLIPAFEWASLNNERVVISTDTIALQDQLINKDIPAIQNALGIHLNAAVLKGRSNYLCPLRVEAMKRRGPTNIEELRVLAKILVWQLENDSGDKTEISLRGPAENSIWNRLSSADSEGCRLNACRDELGIDCPFYKAYKRAESAHILIVNHALLIADARMDNRVLPDYNYIIVDEGHHLEEAVTHSMSFSLDEAAFMRRIADLSDVKRGLLADLMRSLHTSDVPAKTILRMDDYTQNVNQAANEMGSHVKSLFKAIRNFAESIMDPRRNDFITNLRINKSHRTGTYFSHIQQVWDILKQFMEVISDATHELSEMLVKLQSNNIDSYNDLLRNTQTAARYLQETQASLVGFLETPDSNTIYWIKVSQDGNQISLNTAPLHVGNLIAENLWNRRQSVIITSATLRTNDTFDHIRERIHGEIADTYEVGSPFNYKESTLLYLPTDMAEPRDFNQYQRTIEQTTIELAAALQGRVLVLFTNYGQLRQTSKAITPRLAMGNITVYDQSDGTSRQSLLEGFKTTERAVLLGTRSFWEGVDIPGDSLSALIITRLPFPVPSDPIFAARSETYNNSFNDYTVPEAILRFRQGFGRLIRRKTDRGIVVVLDGRITSKQYGTAFLDALPACTVKRATLDDLPGAAVDWLKDS